MLPSISKDSNLLIPKDSKNRKPVTGYATEAFKSLKKLFGFKQSESSSGQCHCPNKAYTEQLQQFDGPRGSGLNEVNSLRYPTEFISSEAKGVAEKLAERVTQRIFDKKVQGTKSLRVEFCAPDSIEEIIEIPSNLNEGLEVGRPIEEARAKGSDKKRQIKNAVITDINEINKRVPPGGDFKLVGLQFSQCYNCLCVWGC